MLNGVRKKLPIDFVVGPGTHPCLKNAWDPSLINFLEEEINKESPDVVFGGVRPLDAAILNNNLSAVQLLISLGADPFLKNQKNYETSLELAIECGFFPVLDCLLESDSKCLNHSFGFGNSILHKAILFNNNQLSVHLMDTFPELLDRVNQNGDTCLMVSCMGKNTDIFLGILERLASKGKEIFTLNKNGVGPLTLAIHNRKISFVHTLVVYPVPYEEMRKGFNESVMTQNWRIFELMNIRMKLAGEDFSEGDEALVPFNFSEKETGKLFSGQERSNDLLLQSIVKGDNKKVLDYKMAGFDLLLTDRFNQPGLMYAIIGNHLSIIKEWGEKLGEWILPNNEGTTPLHVAGIVSSSDIFNEALKQVKEIKQFECKNNFGETPYHYAGFYGNQDGISFFKSNQLSQQRDDLGIKPKQWNVRRKNLELLQRLSQPYWQSKFMKAKISVPNFSVSSFDELEWLLKDEALFIKKFNKKQSPLFRRYLIELNVYLDQINYIAEHEIFPENHPEVNKKAVLKKIMIVKKLMGLNMPDLKK